MKAFYNEFKLDSYSNVVTGVDFNNYFKYNFKAFNVPFIAVFGKDKKLKSAYMGKISINQLEKVVRE